MQKFDRTQFAASLVTLLKVSSISDAERTVLTQVQAELVAGHTNDRLWVALQHGLKPLALKRQLSHPVQPWYNTVQALQSGARPRDAGITRLYWF